MEVHAALPLEEYSFVVLCHVPAFSVDVVGLVAKSRVPADRYAGLHSLAPLFLGAASAGSFFWCVREAKATVLRSGRIASTILVAVMNLYFRELAETFVLCVVRFSFLVNVVPASGAGGAHELVREIFDGFRVNLPCNIIIGEVVEVFFG